MSKGPTELRMTPNPPGSETVSTSSWDRCCGKFVMLAAHTLLVGRATKFGVPSPQACQAQLFERHMSALLVQNQPRPQICAILKSGLKIRFTWGDGSMPD